MKKIICDRCGKDAEGATLSSEDEIYDICRDCDAAYVALWGKMRVEEEIKIKAWMELK